MLSPVNNQAGEVEIVSMEVENSVEENRGSCWQDCLSNQFPVKSFRYFPRHISGILLLTSYQNINQSI